MGLYIRLIKTRERGRKLGGRGHDGGSAPSDSESQGVVVGDGFRRAPARSLPDYERGTPRGPARLSLGSPAYTVVRLRALRRSPRRSAPPQFLFFDSKCVICLIWCVIPCSFPWRYTRQTCLRRAPRRIPAASFGSGTRGRGTLAESRGTDTHPAGV